MVTANTCEETSGFWLIDKPKGITSREAIQTVATQIGLRGMGHSGTLDPQASGLLILLSGRAKRVQQFFTTLPKRYAATIELGFTSPTDDTEAVPVPCSPLQPTAGQVQAVAATFAGDIEQQPPVYSAIKIGGKRAYDLIRQGEAVAIPVRKVKIYGIEIVRYAYPELELTVSCSAGTYIRALARDIGEKLQTGAYLKSLRRTTIGPFSLAQATSIEQASMTTGLSMEEALRPCPSLPLSASLWDKIFHGQRIARPDHISSGTVFLWFADQAVSMADCREEFIYPQRLLRQSTTTYETPEQQKAQPGKAQPGKAQPGKAQPDQAL